MNFKTVAIAGIAFASGFVSSYFIFKNVFEKKNEDEIEEMKEYFETKKKILANDEAKKILLNRHLDQQEDEKRQENDIFKDYKKEASNYIDMYDASESENENEETPFQNETNPDIKIISSLDFDSDMEYEKELLVYYVLDEVLTTEMDEPIDIGFNGYKSHFINDVVYLRDFGLGIDYEIRKEESSYHAMAEEYDKL